jgi:ABC-type transport system involved in multi-copper enzyme maturation permease subunit
MRVLRAEWTKFRTVRGWLLGAAGAVLVSVLFLLVGTVSSSDHPRPAALPVGPGGEAVNDNFYFVHQALTGDGSITVEVTELTGVFAGAPGKDAPGVTPWAKSGIIVKQDLDQGSHYAAMMLTGAHGVRMQHDFTGDRAGLTGHGPRWLRLVRSGTTVTGYDSADGTRWAEVGRVRVALVGTVQVGLFTTAPMVIDDSPRGGGSSPAIATGTFGPVAFGGSWQGDAAGWHGQQVGGNAGAAGSYTPEHQGGWRQVGGGFTITGAGDIGPVVGGPALGPAYTIENFLTGTFVGLIVLTVVAAQYMTSEYRRGLLGLSLAAVPRRGRWLAAKAAIVAAIGLVVGVVVAALSIPLGEQRAHATHFVVLTVPAAVELRAVLGTGLLLATMAVFALGLGTLLRRGATAITAVVATTVLPYLLAFTGILPTGAAEWLLRLSPAAGFAIQQTLPRYAQVLTSYTPGAGYYPLPAWGGYAVLAGWTALALAAAAVTLRRRDA